VCYKSYCRGAFAFAISRKLAVKAMHLLQVSQVLRSWLDLYCPNSHRLQLLVIEIYVITK